MDGRHAVFKTVCGALLRRPGWVRFPSIPATCNLARLIGGRSASLPTAIAPSYRERSA
jgi:hypothetical protein